MKEQIPPILRPEHGAPVSLGAFAERFGIECPPEAKAIHLTGVSMNTNDLRAGDLFVAMPGLKAHGANFADKALALGAVAIGCHKPPLSMLDSH